MAVLILPKEVSLMSGRLWRSLAIGPTDPTSDPTKAADLVDIDRQYDRPTYGMSRIVERGLAVDYAFKKCRDADYKIPIIKVVDADSSLTYEHKGR